MKQIKIYTDGACSAKNNIGGWGTLIIYPNDVEVVMSGTFPDATNNQMELWAVIEALNYIHDKENINHVAIEVVSDSEYVVNGITDWLPKWRQNGWKSKSKEPVKNRPLWEAIHEMTKDLQIKFTWVRGHAGDANNERVDKLAVNAYKDVIKKKAKDENKDTGKGD